MGFYYIWPSYRTHNREFSGKQSKAKLPQAQLFPRKGNLTQVLSLEKIRILVPFLGPKNIRPLAPSLFNLDPIPRSNRGCNFRSEFQQSSASLRHVFNIRNIHWFYLQIYWQGVIFELILKAWMWDIFFTGKELQFGQSSLQGREECIVVFPSSEVVSDPKGFMYRHIIARPLWRHRLHTKSLTWW